MSAGDIDIEQQLDAAPGFEWFWQVERPHDGSGFRSYVCGTATTQDEACAAADAAWAEVMDAA